MFTKSKMVITIGEMVEWSITAVLKTAVLRGTGGSNPSLSANKGVNQQVMRFTPFITPKNQAVKKKVTPKTNSLGSSSLLREVYKFEKRKDFTFGTILTNHFGKRNFLRHFG